MESSSSIGCDLFVETMNIVNLSTRLGKTVERCKTNFISQVSNIWIWTFQPHDSGGKHCTYNPDLNHNSEPNRTETNRRGYLPP